jgi:PPP family 3-phenylpropionic acid transporter
MLVSTAWGWLAAIVSIRMMTAGTQDALMNRLTMAHLKERGQINFGGIRLWGALSFAATSLLTGWLARDHSVSILFPLAGILGLLAALCVTGFPERISARTESNASLTTLQRAPALLALFTLIFFLTLGKSGYETFGNIYIKTTLGANNTWIGLLGAIGSLTPVFAFIPADRILARFGKINTLLFGMILSALAFLWLAFAPSPAWTLPAVIFNGAGGAFYLVGLVNLLSQLGHPEQAATDQMLAQLTLPGLAGILAQPISGWALDTLGGKTLFLTCAVFTILCACFILIKKKMFAL